jgi:c(7)-type cytochrome triheme protein
MFDTGMKKTILLITACLAIVTGMALAQQPWYDLPELPPPYQYGNILINRSSSDSDIQAVTFSHWRHRIKYTCRVCHFELDFEMSANATEITEEMNKNGQFCGFCHNGKTAFGHTAENCSNCHNGDISYGKGKFRRFYRAMPKDRFGNRINWSKAVKRGHIRPRQSVLDDNYSPMPFEKFLLLEAEWSHKEKDHKTFPDEIHP